jgi:CO dehydrogenase maturation factor
MNGYSENIPKTIAVTGKGGAGKTVLSTLMIKCLVERKNLRILAVDADSAKGLPYTLGMKVTKTVSDFRQDIIRYPDEKRRIADLHMGTVIGEMIEPGPGFDLLVMGRPEAPGCFCTVNDLLRYGIETLSKNYDVTIIDGEAGPEQINRRVMQHLDALLVVGETSMRSLETARDIMEVAKSQDIVQKDQMGLVINKYTGENDRVEEIIRQMDLPLWGYIPDDENVSRYDALNRPLLELPAGSPSLSAVSQILKHIW